MITMLMVVAILAVVYGFFWHDLPAETHRRHSADGQPERTSRAVAAPNPPPPPLEESVGERRPFTRLRVNRIGAHLQPLPGNNNRILHKPIHQLNEA